MNRDAEDMFGAAAAPEEEENAAAPPPAAEPAPAADAESGESAALAEAGKGAAPASEPQRPLPWQDAQWRRVAEQIAGQRLPHALLLRGGRGAGKERFARALAARLLCLSPVEELSCGACAGCRLLHFGSHPDLRILSPENEGGQVGVQRVRELLDNFSTSAQRGGWRIALFLPAEALNMHSANALLKSLEEPGAEALFLLVSHYPERLPATVRSRCQSLDFPPPPASQALPWLRSQLPSETPAEELLAAAAGLPLAALQLHEDGAMQRNIERIEQWRDFRCGRIGVIELASQWGGERTRETVEWLIDWLLDARRLQVGGEAELLRHPGANAELRELGENAAAETLHRVLLHSLQTLKRLQGATNPDPGLALEELLAFCATTIFRERSASGREERE